MSKTGLSLKKTGLLIVVRKHLFVFLAALALLAPAAILSGTEFSAAAYAASSGEWQYRDGHWYFLNADGSYRTGWQEYGGKWYYLDPTQNGAMVTGVIKLGNSAYLLDPSSGAMIVGNWGRSGQLWYYADKWGRLQTGWQQINKKWYYLDPAQNGAMAAGIVTCGTAVYLTDPSSGALTVNQWVKIGSEWYRSNGWGNLLTGWQQINNKWYYLNPDRNGAMETGVITVSNSTYLIDPATGALTVNSWKEVAGDWYLSDKWGYVRTGWVESGGKWYYLDPGRNGAMARNQFVSVSGNKYFVNGYGILQTNTVVKYQNQLYYVDGWGVKAEKAGWINSGSSRYYVTDSTGVLKKGWLTLNANYYFLGDDGAALTGRHTIGGHVYFFNKEGALIESNGKTVVLDPGHSSVVASGTVPLGPGSSERKDADSLGTKGVVTGVYEYQLNLTMAFKIQKELETRGYTVYLTRYDNNTPMDCIKRAQVATEKGADIFVRLHANNDPRNSSRTGAMTICITRDNPFVPEMFTKSRLLSDKILDAYVAATGCVKEEVWETDTMTGNNWSTVPATLIEFGYMSNAGEDRRMQDSAYQDKMALGVANGIDNYFSALR